MNEECSIAVKKLQNFLIFKMERKKIDEFKIKIEKIIFEILNKKCKETNNDKTLFSFCSKESLNIAYKVRQLQMKEGKIAQTIFGNFNNWTDLKNGHKSGLDVIKDDNSIIVEIKNKWNTMNSSSRAEVLN